MADPEETRQVRLDARNLRGIAHPLRVRLLAMLRMDGPATATSLAQRLGINTGATSYHLRQLAEHGFIEDVPDRGSDRERWWRAVHANTTFPDRGLAADDTSPGAAYRRSVVQVQADNMLRAVDELSTLPTAWRDAQDFSDYVFRLTPAEAEDLAKEIHAVLRRRTSDPESLQQPTKGTARVTFQFQMFPDLGDLGPPDDAAAREDQ